MKTITEKENLDKSDGLSTAKKSEDGGWKPLRLKKTLISQMALALQKKTKTEDENYYDERKSW